MTNSVVQNVWVKDQLLPREFVKKRKFRQTHTFCGGGGEGGQWDSYDADLPPGVEPCQRHSHAAEGINIGPENMIKEQSDGLRVLLATAP